MRTKIKTSCWQRKTDILQPNFSFPNSIGENQKSATTSAKAIPPPAHKSYISWTHHLPYIDLTLTNCVDFLAPALPETQDACGTRTPRKLHRRKSAIRFPNCSSGDKLPFYLVPFLRFRCDFSCLLPLLESTESLQRAVPFKFQRWIHR